LNDEAPASGEEDDDIDWEEGWGSTGFTDSCLTHAMHENCFAV
jgi:hypothetical protein